MNVLNLINSCQSVSGVTIKSVMVTPHVAKKMMELNVNNRCMSQMVVDKYAKDMISGNWTISSQAIGFDINGYLIDGQHRLQAVVESGVTVAFVIVCGLPNDTQEKIDRNKKRTIFDVLSLSGCVDTKKAAQIATFLARVETTGSNGYTNNTDTEIKNCLLKHQKSIEEIVKATSNISQSKGLGRIGFLSACVLYYEKKPSNAIDFTKKVITGELLTIKNPAMRLRKYLLGEYVINKRHDRITIGGKGLQSEDFRRTIFAINAFDKGKEIVALQESDKINIYV